MKEEKNGLPFLRTAGIQKLLLISVCLLLCTLVYLYIGQSAKEQDARFVVMTASPTPLSPSPAPTPVKPHGVPLETVLSRFQDSGFTLSASEKNPEQYDLRDDLRRVNGTLTFFSQNTLCCGFELAVEGAGTTGEIKTRLSGGDENWAEQNSKMITVALDEYREAHFKEQENYIYKVLPALLRAISDDGAFTNVTSSGWSALSVQARNTERLQHDEANGYLFSASRKIDDTIVIAVGY